MDAIHSRLPWRFVPSVLGLPAYVFDADDRDIMALFRGPVRATADAEFVVRACNNFGEMLAVLKQIDQWARERDGDKRVYAFAFDAPVGIALRAAIANAEGNHE